MKYIFKILGKINKRVLPSYTTRDLTKLSKFDKLIIGYRYYITKHSLD